MEHENLLSNFNIDIKHEAIRKVSSTLIGYIKTRRESKMTSKNILSFQQRQQVGKSAFNLQLLFHISMRTLKR